MMPQMHLLFMVPPIYLRFKSSASVIATNEEDTHIPRVLENSKQPLRSYQIGGISLPQKLGEVIIF